MLGFAAFIMAAMVTGALAIRFAYVASNSIVRKVLLDKRRIKQGQLAYELYKRIYTTKFALSCSLLSLSWILYAASIFVESSNGRHTGLSLSLGIVSMFIGLSGAIFGSYLLKLHRS